MPFDGKVGAVLVAREDVPFDTDPLSIFIVMVPPEIWLCILVPVVTFLVGFAVVLPIVVGRRVDVMTFGVVDV